MQKISFTVEDLRSPDRLELVLRQFESAIQSIQKSVASVPQLDVQAIAGQVAGLIRPQLEATGSSPLFKGNLLPTKGSDTTTP